MAMLGTKCSPCCAASPCEKVCPCTHAHAYAEADAGSPGNLFALLSNVQIGAYRQGTSLKATPDNSGAVVVDSKKFLSTFGNFTYSCPGQKVEGPNLLSVSFDPTCFGSGVAATVTAPGGGNPGPISSVTLTNKGGGYAEFGRSAPTLAVANVGTAPAAFTIELESSQDECGRHLWSVSSIAIVKAGEGYVDGQTLALTAGQDDTVVIAANGTLHTIREQPTLEVKFPNGSGATFTVELVANGNQPETWSIWAITFTGTTSGFIDEQEAQITGPALVTVTPALAYASTRRIAPALSVTVDSSGGVGATFTATLEETGSTPPTWRVIDLAIESAGVGYKNNEPIVATVPGGVEVVPLSGTINVNQDGEVESVFVSVNGEYYEPTDELESVRIVASGEFYQTSGQLEAITITDGGSYYKTDDQAKAYVQTIKGSISPGPVSGSPTFITGKVDESVNSPTFGQVTSLKIQSSGGKYNGWDWLDIGAFDVERANINRVGYEIVNVVKDECGCAVSLELQLRSFIWFYITGTGSVSGLPWENENATVIEFRSSAIFAGCDQTEAIALYEESVLDWLQDPMMGDPLPGVDVEFNIQENGCLQDFYDALFAWGIGVGVWVDACECGACCDESTGQCRDTTSPRICVDPPIYQGSDYQGANSVCSDGCNPLP